MAAAEQVDALNEAIDASIMNIPGMAELDNLAATAQEAAQGVMDKLNDAIPSIKLPDVPFGELGLQDQMKELAALTALGYLQAPKIAAKLAEMKAKYSGTDVDIDNLAQLLRSGALDIDEICKLVPNVNTDGINVEVKGIPTTFPDIDPVDLDVNVVSRKQADDFLDIELPSFNF